MYSVKAQILTLIIFASCVKPDSDTELKNTNPIMSAPALIAASMASGDVSPQIFTAHAMPIFHLSK